MREILFRGKCKDTGKWYAGYYINLHKTTYCFKEDYEADKDNDIHQIVFEKMTDWGLPNRHLRVDVIPSTIGQYTGLTDKNGKRIFEGDIVKIHYDSAMWGNNREVVFEEGQWFFKDNTISQKSYMGAWGNSVVEVISNIHDNPELLKEREG